MLYHMRRYTRLSPLIQDRALLHVSAGRLTLLVVRFCSILIS
jgi:hypothetical protein